MKLPGAMSVCVCSFSGKNICDVYNNEVEKGHKSIWILSFDSAACQTVIIFRHFLGVTTTHCLACMRVSTRVTSASTKC